MAIPTGTFTDADIAAELGLTAPWTSDDIEAIAEFTRPWSDTDLAGFSLFQINTSMSGYIQDSNPTAPCTVSISLNTNGTTSGVGALMTVPNWGTKTIAGVGSEWEVMCTRVAGSVPGQSAMDTYLALTSGRLWSITDTTDNGNPVTSTIKFTFRKAGTTSPTYTTGNITLDATRGIGL